MKKRIFTIIIAAAMSAMIFLPSCNKDDNEVKISHKDSAKVIEVLTKSQYAVGGNFSPNNGAKDIYVGTDFSIKPGVALNTPFEVKLADQTVIYRYDLKACTITDASGADFATDYNYSEQDTLITINSKILNGNTEYTLSSTIALMQQINGEWQPVVYNGDAKEYVSTSLFTTCQAADTLRPADILFSYPIDRQLNYMPKEYQEGYIMLSYKYPELFNGASANDMKVIIKNITDDTKAEQSTLFTVKESHEVEGEAVELGYSLKNITFDPNQIYSLAFYCGDKKVHQIYFRTSFYETLKSKLAHASGLDDVVHAITSFYHEGLPLDYYLRRNYPFTFEGNEDFDKFECQRLYYQLPPTYDNGLQYARITTIQDRLITLDADLENWNLYKEVFKIVYDHYSFESILGNSKEKDERGWIKFPPSNAMEIYCADEPTCLTDEEISNKTLNPLEKKWSYIFWYQVPFLRRDLYLIHQENYDPDDEFEKQIDQLYYNLLRGSSTWEYDTELPYFISFKLPGKNIITYSEKRVVIYEK